MFKADDEIRQIAEAYSLDAVDHAKGVGIKLDWTEPSVEKVEKILGILHEQMSNAKPTEDQVFTFAKIYGSYIGEVFRKSHVATWGTVVIDGHESPGMQAEEADLRFWPWERARKRITNGLEDNVWHYYQALLENVAPVGSPKRESSASKVNQRKPWWRFW
jgi:hypothetical protein